MANIALAFTPTPTPFPFVIPDGAVLPSTPIPRQRLTFLLAQAVITAKIATNTTTIAINAVCPANYAYTIEYAGVNIECATDLTDADNFQDLGAFTFVQHQPAGSFTRVNLVAPGIYVVGAGIGSGKAWEPANPYGGPLYNLDGDPVLINMELADIDAGATQVGACTAVIQVLQYDLEQVFNYAMNFPLPVTTRGL